MGGYTKPELVVRGDYGAISRGEFGNRYLQSRMYLRETTRDLHRLTTQYLKQFFGGEWSQIWYHFRC